MHLVALLCVVTLQLNIWDGFQREIPYLVMWMGMMCFVGLIWPGVVQVEWFILPENESLSAKQTPANKFDCLSHLMVTTVL